ncbi:hypothetical protein KFU94_60305 [Chloroflexi bacterium TSY]|nr:hypothetical protein [Chloroflexi bacterium TSY]
MVAVFMEDKRQIQVVQDAVPAYPTVTMIELTPCQTAVAAVIVDVVFMVLGFVGLHASANKDLTIAACVLKSRRELKEDASFALHTT